MRIHDERRRLAHIPVRICALPDSRPRGTILFYHGLGVDIGIQTFELHSLAAAGFCAIGVDAPGHGQRRWPDFEARFADDAQASLGAVLEQAVDELPSLLDAIIEHELASPGRIGLGGISMGGFITYGAALVEPRLQVLTPIIGSPRWPAQCRLQPEQQPEAFSPRALLSQTAANDEVVDPSAARVFHQALSRHYQPHLERLAYVEHPDCGHHLPHRQWLLLWQNVLDWYSKHMPL